MIEPMALEDEERDASTRPRQEHRGHSSRSEPTQMGTWGTCGAK